MEEDATVSMVAHVNKILQSIFSKKEVYINNQKMYISYGLYTHKFYTYNIFEAGNSEYKGISDHKMYDYKECPNELMDAPLSEPFFKRRIKKLSRPDGFM